MIDLDAEGEVIVSHPVRPPSLSGTKAMCTVCGAFAGGDTEHVDEPMSGGVAANC